MLSPICILLRDRKTAKLRNNLIAFKSSWWGNGTYLYCLVIMKHFPHGNELPPKILASECCTPPKPL